MLLKKTTPSSILSSKAASKSLSNNLPFFSRAAAVAIPARPALVPDLKVSDFNHIDQFAAHCATISLPASATYLISAPSELYFQEFLVLSQITFENLKTCKCVIFDDAFVKFAIRDEAGILTLWNLCGDIIAM